MIERYRIPIHGTVITTAPLAGDPADPLSVLNISEVPGQPVEIVDTQDGPREMPKGYLMQSIEYDLDAAECLVEVDADEDVHRWITDMLVIPPGKEKKSSARALLDVRGLSLKRQDIATRD